jgi:hypothetical protein
MRYFTVQEAEAFVPALEAVFDDIHKLRKKVVHLAQELEGFGEASTSGDLAMALPADVESSRSARREQIVEALAAIRLRVQELESHGLIVRQLDGNVDFRSKRGQKNVLLCWRKGEHHIGHWHDLAQDEEARQPVDRLFSKPALMN